MTQEVTNFARFYALLKKLPYSMNIEKLKEEIVLQYTCNRTSSLREMTAAEYAACCKGMEGLAEDRDRLRKLRSACLKLMQKLGVDTTDWARVDRFCENPRIAGMPFACISADGLAGLQKKLRAIGRNGGPRHKDNETKQPAAVVCITAGSDAPKC